MNPELIYKYLENTATDAETEQVLDWLDADPAHVRELDELDKVMAASVIYGPTCCRLRLRRRRRAAFRWVAFRCGASCVMPRSWLRWGAAGRADLKTLPAYIREVDDENLHAMALVENIQRQDLNAIEIALGMQRLIDECNLTQDALSEKVGKKRSTVSNYMRLLKLPDEVQLALRRG